MPRKPDPDWATTHGKDIWRLRTVFKSHYRNQGRSFPWRTDLNPFQTLLTECLLQRTRADIVVRVWEGFMTEFTCIQDLAEAPTESIKKAIRPLGLAWRAGFLKKLAVDLKDRFQGNVPSTSKDLMSLPGVGPYITAATRSFGHNIRDGITDSNTVRVFSRYFNTRIEGDKAPLRYWRLLSKIIANSPDHKLINYGMLDFASDICRPGKPSCNLCDLRKSCLFP